MLVLSRKVGEQIDIGNDIVITIVRAESKKVRIGIDAPRSVEIVRSELVGRDAPSPEERARAAQNAGFTC